MSRSLDKISARVLWARSRQMISMQGLWRSWQGISQRSCQEISFTHLVPRSCMATTTTIWHAQNAERVARAIWKQAAHHSESDLTRPKRREGCARDLKTSTAPQRGQTDMRKVTRGLREHMLHFQQMLRTPRNMTIENVRNAVLPRYQALFCGASHCACHETWAWGIRRIAPAMPDGHHVLTQQWRQFHKTRLLTVSKHRPAPATKKDFWKHLSFWPTPANISATCRKHHACHTDEKVSDVLHLSSKQMLRVSKNEHGARRAVPFLEDIGEGIGGEGGRDMEVQQHNSHRLQGRWKTTIWGLLLRDSSSSGNGLPWLKRDKSTGPSEGLSVKVNLRKNGFWDRVLRETSDENGRSRNSGAVSPNVPDTNKTTLNEHQALTTTYTAVGK